MVPDDILGQAWALAERARNLPAEDPKLDALLRIVDETMADTESPGKLLVFSFFLHTIDYIAGKLTTAGVRAAVITGKSTEDERDDLRERFRLPRTNPEAIDVLISSEVGCEGLDYEFCDRMVNYDIPWNPMRVEQRIGRIDRYGQQAEKVLIFNFVTPGTVEERVFHRCFERLGVFSDTIGDLEEVLGPLVEDLMKIALDPRLTPEQAEAKAQQAAANALLLTQEQRSAEEASADLVGFDIADDVEKMMAQGRYVSGQQLRDMVRRFLDHAVPGAKLQAGKDETWALRTNDAARIDLASRMGGRRTADRATQRFLAALQRADVLEVTFDQATAARKRDVEFITPSHPLTRAATAHWDGQPGNLAAHLTVTSDEVPPGSYIFVCDQWEQKTVRSEVSLQAFVVRTDGAPCQISQEQLLSLLNLAAASPAPSDVMAAPVLSQCLEALDQAAEAARRQALGRLAAGHQLNLDRRLASLDNYQAARLERAQHELESATEEKIRRMKAGEVNRIRADHAHRRSELLSRGDVDVFARRLAVGHLEVTRAP